MQLFELEDHPYIPLCDLLKLCGLTQSGGQAKHVIEEGLVKVDGRVETRKRCKIITGQVVDFDGETVKVV